MTRTAGAFLFFVSTTTSPVLCPPNETKKFWSPDAISSLLDSLTFCRWSPYPALLGHLRKFALLPDLFYKEESISLLFSESSLTREDSNKSLKAARRVVGSSVRRSHGLITRDSNLPENFLQTQVA